jgi:sucrose-6-phosphate hydrolase SacC (GH32 family)
LKLHVFVDRCSVEVFGNDAVVCLADLIFPEPRARKPEVYADGGIVTLSSLQFHRLKSILG